MALLGNVDSLRIDGQWMPYSISDRNDSIIMLSKIRCLLDPANHETNTPGYLHSQSRLLMVSMMW